MRKSSIEEQRAGPGCQTERRADHTSTGGCPCDHSRREQRVLLLRYAESGGFWATPGGALEAGEDPSSAARRELHEELGISANVELSTPLAKRSREHHVGGRLVRQVEQYFLARLAPADINPARATQTDNIRSRRWWPLYELHATSETIYPVGLPGLLTRLVANGMPDRPVVLE